MKKQNTGNWTNFISLDSEMMQKLTGGSFGKIIGIRRLEDGSYLVDIEYPSRRFNSL